MVLCQASPSHCLYSQPIASVPHQCSLLFGTLAQSCFRRQSQVYFVTVSNNNFKPTSLHRRVPAPPQRPHPNHSYESHCSLPMLICSSNEVSLSARWCWAEPPPPLKTTASTLTTRPPLHTALCSLPMLTCPSDGISPSSRWCCAELANPPPPLLLVGQSPLVPPSVVGRHLPVLMGRWVAMAVGGAAQWGLEECGGCGSL